MGLIGALLGEQRVQFIHNNNTVIQFDAVMNEGHKQDSPMTKFPIEDGTNISDDMILEPFTLTLKAIISDSPIGTAGQILTEVGTTLSSKLLPPRGLQALAGGVAIFSALSGSKKRSVTNYEQLSLLQKNKLSFDVLTSIKRYTGMYITSLSEPRDHDTGKALVFDIVLTQPIIVSPQTVNVDIFANPGLSANLSNQGEKSAQLPNGFADGQAKFKSLAGGQS